MAASRRKRLLVSLLALLAAILLVEVGFRLFVANDEKNQELRSFLREGTNKYEPHPYTGYVLEDFDDPQDTTRPVSWSFDREKRPGVPRIAFLGGSTTAGGFPLFVKERLEQETGQEFDVMNWGVDGWSTIETMVNYFVNVQDYEPDAVVIHHALNDVAPRRRFDYRNDYSHWRKPWQQVQMSPVKRWFLLHSDLCAWAFFRGSGVGSRLKDFVDKRGRGLSSNGNYADLEPGTVAGFMRNVRTIAEHAESHGGLVVLYTMPYNPGKRAKQGKTLWEGCVEEHNQFFRDLAAERGYLLVDGERVFGDRAEEVLPLFIDRVHVNRKGKILKATLVTEALIEDGRLLQSAHGRGE